jgi:hypothetical protein
MRFASIGHPDCGAVRVTQASTAASPKSSEKNIGKLPMPRRTYREAVVVVRWTSSSYFAARSFTFVR